MAAMSEVPPTGRPRTTLRTIRQRVAAGEKFPMLTCYDATTAGWLLRGGVDVLLVGDTAAQFILGHDSTLPAPMSFMLQITAAVRRGAPQAYVMADMPFGSYHCGDDAAMRNAVRFMARAGADAVKFELDESQAGLVRRLASAGVPVVAHLGSRPQQKAVQGRYRKLYHTAEDVERVIHLARHMVEQGAVMILLEAVPDEISRGVVEAVTHARPDGEPVPVIGCGAGPACHGHVVVLHDVLGMTDWHAPFAAPLGEVGAGIAKTAARWAELVRSGAYLKDDHPYHLNR